MILFWDKNLPRTIPEALRTLNPKVGNDKLGIEIYLDHYPLSDQVAEGSDERWLSDVGQKDWLVITQDWSLHSRENQLLAMKQHHIGCFYLWGATDTKWEILRCFARGYDNILAKAATTPRPFIYWVARNGSLRNVPIPP